MHTFSIIMSPFKCLLDRTSSSQVAGTNPCSSSVITHTSIQTSLITILVTSPACIMLPPFTAVLVKRQTQRTDIYSLQSIPALTLTMSQRINRSAIPPPLHHSLHNSRSLKDNNDTRIDPTSITVLSQNPDIDARGEVSMYACSQLPFTE